MCTVINIERCTLQFLKLCDINFHDYFFHLELSYKYYYNNYYPIGEVFVFFVNVPR